MQVVDFTTRKRSNLKCEAKLINSLKNFNGWYGVYVQEAISISSLLIETGVYGYQEVPKRVS